MTKRAIKTRRVKLEEGIKPQTKEKFLITARDEDVLPTMPRLEPKNARQKEAMAMLREGRSVVFLTGSAGTGKSLIAAHHAASLYRQKKVDKIYLVRPAVSVGKSVGALPGTLEEKLSPYFSQTIEHIQKFLGVGHTQYCLRTKAIEMCAVEFLRGRSFENCIVLFDEVQNFTLQEIEMCITRLGEGGTFLFMGDTKQNDLRVESGLKSIVSLLERIIETQPTYLDDEDLDNVEDLVGFVNFLPEDVVRSGLTKAFVKIFYHNG